MPLRAASIAAALGLLALVVAIAVAGAQHDRRPLATNGIRPLDFVANLPPADIVCQTKEIVPEGTEGVWVRAATRGKPTPPLIVTFGATRGTIAGGWREGDVVVPVPRVGAEQRYVELCLHNNGSTPVELAGENTFSEEYNASIGQAIQRGRIRLEFEPQGRPSWWAITPRVAERLSVVRAALPGIATLPLYVLLALVVAGGAVALVLREARQ